MVSKHPPTRDPADDAASRPFQTNDQTNLRSVYHAMQSCPFLIDVALNMNRLFTARSRLKRSTGSLPRRPSPLLRWRSLNLKRICVRLEQGHSDGSSTSPVTSVTCSARENAGTIFRLQDTHQIERETLQFCRMRLSLQARNTVRHCDC